MKRSDGNEIRHVGVLGMHWGVRRGGSASGDGHKERVAALKTQIKAAKRADIEKWYSGYNKALGEVDSKYAALAAKRVSELKTSSSPRVIAHIRKMSKDNADSKAWMHESFKTEDNYAKTMNAKDRLRKNKANARFGELVSQYEARPENKARMNEVLAMKFPKRLVEATKDLGKDLKTYRELELQAELESYDE